MEIKLHSVYALLNNGQICFNKANFGCIDKEVLLHISVHILNIVYIILYKFWHILYSTYVISDKNPFCQNAAEG